MPVEQITADGTVTYYHQDQLGSTRTLTDASGNVTGTSTYDPYGRLTNSTGTTTPVGYAGQYTDPETGYQYLRARYYDPGTAQFLTRDPADATTRSAYGYTTNDPLNGTDPTGLDVLSKIFHAGVNFQAGILNGVASTLSGGLLHIDAPYCDASTFAYDAGNLTGTVGTAVALAVVAPEDDVALLGEETESSGAQYIFRTGSQTDNALTDAGGVSFRDSVSSAADRSQVFNPGDKVFTVDTQALPDGSVVYDGTPDGHVTVNATPEEIRAAIARTFPDNPLEELRQLGDGSWRLPRK